MKINSWLAVLIASLAMATHTMAAEGMWTLDNLPSTKMQNEFGFTPGAPLVDRMMHASLRIAGGCSASFISKEGLVMTNHHCAARCIEQLSTAKKDFVATGFLAKNREEEVRCPEIELNRLETITDVSDQVKRATAGLEGDAFKRAQNAIRASLSTQCVGADKDTVRCDVVDLYHGGRYHLYRYHRFQDARLVFAPEKSIAFFGGDPDNFNFPRYDLDVSMLRAYENGKPAIVNDFFPFSKTGAQQGEMVFVTGHPGTTQRQLTMAQLRNVRDLQLINGLLRLAELRGVLEQYRHESAEAARVADTDLFGIENAYKGNVGRLEALLDPTLMQQKQAEESALRAYVAAQPALQKTVGGAWDAIERAEAVNRAMNTEATMLEGARGFGGKYFSFARALVRGAQEREKPNGERFPEFTNTRLPAVEQALFSTAPIYPSYEKILLGFSLTKMREQLGVDHAVVKQVLGKQSPDQLAATLIDHTSLGDPAVRKQLWQGGMPAILASNDPFIKLALAVDPSARAIRQRLEQEVDAVIQKNSELIAQARFARDGTSAYPDATFTLRLSYGAVDGWVEGDRPINAFTQVAGAFARDTGIDPFALPDSWHKAKVDLNPAQRVNFVTTHDIIGGNSGSPMVNRQGEIVGLIFDGNIHSLGGAFGYDAKLNRAVAVHSGMLLESLQKIYHAENLVGEILGRATR